MFEPPAPGGLLWLSLEEDVLYRVRHEFRRLLVRILDRLSTQRLESLLYELVDRRAEALPVNEALRFLLRLDVAFYGIQGRKAVESDGGLHTKHRHMRYHDFFVARIHPGERGLDIGCGAVPAVVAKRTRNHPHDLRR